jgi:O-antigen ligase
MAERACFLLLLGYLFWLPLPFGSVIDAAYVPLVLVPVVLCAVAALLRLREAAQLEQATAYRIWTAGAIAFFIVIALQLIPLPPAVLAAISPESSTIWGGAAKISALIQDRAPAAGAFPISVDPDATWHELFRLLALFATFQAAALLVHTHPRRLGLAAVLSASALFQMLYGLREAALRRYAIWGWVNTKIFDRITGTFVNPNHFAHYIGLILPITLLFAAVAWRESAAREIPLKRHLLRMVEKHLALVGCSLIAAVGCVGAILVAKSRGALLAVVAGMTITGAMLAFRAEERDNLDDTRRRRHKRTRNVATRVAVIVAGFTILVAGIVAFLGTERTVARFRPTAVEEQTLVGRTVGMKAALDLWRRFPLLGSGFGTFSDVVSMTQPGDDVFFNHAHNDYLEVAATAGTVGFAVAVGSFFAGYAALVRSTFGRRWRSGMWRRRLFQVAAVASLTVAVVHALFDFNFYIPSNAATLAAIAGTAVSLVLTRTRERSESAAAPDFV